MNIKKISSLLWGILFLGVLVSCNGQEDMPGDPYAGQDGIRFRAYLQTADMIKTRADDDEKYMIGSDLYPCKFYVQAKGKDFDEVMQSRAGTFQIPSGFEGALAAVIDPNDPDDKVLNWFSRVEPHEFWGWTLPDNPDFRPGKGGYTDYENGIKIKFKDTDLSGTTNLKNSTSAVTLEWDEESWANGRCLEQMIGAYNAPFTYETDGIYVPLHFRHLISKIFLGNLTVVNNYGGKSDSKIRGVITFYGLPTEATLYPCGNGDRLWPYVDIGDWKYDKRTELKYAITNNSTTYYWEGHSVKAVDCWYIPPEIDFSKLEYKIEIQQWNATLEVWEPNPNYGIHGAYYGDFSNVKFERTGDSRYDSPDGGDGTILHAGEYLNLSVTLYQKGNPGVGGYVTSMAPPNERDAYSHDHPGIYSVEQMRELAAVMGGGDQDAIDEYYKMNGSGYTTAEDPEGEYPDYEDIYGQELNIISLFDDIGTDASGYNSSQKVGPNFNIADGYILDGQGHTVNVNTPSSSSYTITLGPMRDIYLRYYYNNREYIVYIDKMGQVWKVNPSTYEETPTSYNVKNAKSNPFTLRLSDGMIS